MPEWLNELLPIFILLVAVIIVISRLPKVEGLDYSKWLCGGENPSDGAAVITCPQPFAQWNPAHHGGCEYRGLRTKRHTYARTRRGPWLLYDNEADPYQVDNLIGGVEFATLQAELDAQLQRKLRAMGDEFLAGAEYMRRWGYPMDDSGAVPYAD